MMKYMFYYTYTYIKKISNNEVLTELDTGGDNNGNVRTLTDDKIFNRVKKYVLRVSKRKI